MKVLRAGDRIGDRYVVDKVLARGGMGAVYRATDERLGRSVAVKVILGELGEDATSIKRFEREARATAQLSHPGIVSVLDFGTTPDGLAYLVMELVPGATLAEVLGRGRLAPLRAADIVEQALGALAAAHAAGIVHRDLKPGNLMLVPVGEGGREIVKVLDFGVAQIKATAAYTRLTQTGVVVGTPSYMSPEQARGDTCDARTDVYAMGMVLWCCLTGTRPFDKRDVLGLVQAVQHEVPPRADAIAQDVPPALATIAAKALEKRPEARYQTASELAAALVAMRAAPRAPSAPTRATSPAPEPTAVTKALVDPNTRLMAQAPSPAPPPTKVALPPMPSAVPREMPRVEIGAAVAKRRVWPRVVGCMLVASLPVIAFVVLLALLLILFLQEADVDEGSPFVTAPTGSASPRLSVSPAPSDDPSYGEPLCVQAIECCHAFTTRVEPMMPTCEQVVSFAQGDVPTCQRQLEDWRGRASGHGQVLEECE